MGSTTTAFSLHPGTASTAAFDWTNSNDLKLHKMAVDKLTHEFGMEPSNIRNFLTEVGTRADIVGFSTIFEIDVTRVDATGTSTTIQKDLLNEYGQIRLGDVQQTAAVYIGTDSRKAQLEAMLYTCLSSSLSSSAQKRMSLKREGYEIGGRKAGSCYLKIIMMETQQDTNATSKYLRDNIRELDQYIVKIDSDIIKFNDYVQEQLEGLAARGETTHDLLTNLFRAYKSVSDKEFIRYIKDKETDYEDGEDVTASELMSKAKNRYKTMMQNGEWNSPTEDEAKIIALQAEMKAFKGGKSQERSPKGNDDRNRQRKDERPAWMFVQPKDGEPATKLLEGDPKQWHWCKTHSAWGRHTAIACKGKGFRPAKTANAAEATKGSDAEDGPAPTPALQMSAALANMAIIEDPDDE
jgi:hypothetical protein